MSRRPRPEYDTVEFRKLWMSEKDLQEFANRLGVSVPSVWRAGMRRGFPHRTPIKMGHKASEDA